MKGKKLFEWNYSDMAKGQSTSNELPDGGFSPTTDQIQLTKTPGVAYAPATAVDQSTNLTGVMIASCEDPSGNYDRLFTSGNSDDGRFYSYTSGVLTQRGSTDSSHAYIQGKTDMIGFDGEVYITSASKIVRWSSIGSSNTFDTAWASLSNALAPHPALRYQNFAYYGDGNLLKRQAAANVAPVTILTLPAGWIIVALGVDPGSGSMLISVIGQINLSDTLNSGASVLFYNGSSSTFQRQVTVDDMVTAFPATEGALYAAYGQNLGVWNGSGITFLKHIDITFSFTKMLYKQHFTSIGSTLYFIENNKIMALGPIRQHGSSVFYPAFANTPSGTPTDLSHIANVGQNKIAYSYATDQFFCWDSSSVATSNTQALYTNSYQFDNEMWIFWIRVIWKNQVNNNADPGSLRILDENGVVTAANPGTSGLLDLKNTSGAASAVKDMELAVRIKEAQLEVLTDTVNPGIKRIIVYGAVADKPTTP